MWSSGGMFAQNTVAFPPAVGGQAFIRGRNESFDVLSPLPPSGGTVDFEALVAQSNFNGNAANLVVIEGHITIVQRTAGVNQVVNMQPISDNVVLVTAVNFVDALVLPNVIGEFQVVAFWFLIPANLVGAGAHDVGIRIKNNGAIGQDLNIETTHLLVTEFIP